MVVAGLYKSIFVNMLIGVGLAILVVSVGYAIHDAMRETRLTEARYGLPLIESKGYSVVLLYLRLPPSAEYGSVTIVPASITIIYADGSAVTYGEEVFVSRSIELRPGEETLVAGIAAPVGNVKGIKLNVESAYCYARQDVGILKIASLKEVGWDVSLYLESGRTVEVRLTMAIGGH